MPHPENEESMTQDSDFWWIREIDPTGVVILADHARRVIDIDSVVLNRIDVIDEMLSLPRRR